MIKISQRRCSCVHLLKVTHIGVMFGEVLEKTLGQGVGTSALEKQEAYNFMSNIHDKLFDLMERVATIDDDQLKQMYKRRIKETKKTCGRGQRQQRQ